MRKSPNQGSLKEMIDIFKRDYNSPTKALIWAKAIKEWGAPILWGVLFLIIFLSIIFLRWDSNTNSSHGYSQDHQIIVSHLPNIVKFIDITKRSLNERQQLYKRLMEIVDLYRRDNLEEGNIQLKMRHFSSLLDICNSAKERFMKDFSQNGNAFRDPEIFNSYQKILNDADSLPNPKSNAITAQSEKEQWNLLCKICENEVQKANNELLQVLQIKAQ